MQTLVQAINSRSTMNLYSASIFSLQVEELEGKAAAAAQEKAAAEARVQQLEREIAEAAQAAAQLSSELQSQRELVEQVRGCTSFLQCVSRLNAL